MARKKTTRKNLRSTPAFDEPWSRNEAILQNILGASNTLVDPQSRIEAILQAILYGTAYTDEPQSRMEELLLCILNGETTDMEPISRNEAILIAKINGDSYTEEPQSRIEELLIAWLNAYIEKTVTGNPITVNDAVAQNVMALLAELVPAQDLHGYSEPWPGGGGKNKANPSDVQYGATFTFDQETGVISTTEASDVNFIYWLRDATAGSTYTLSALFTAVTGECQLQVRDSNGNAIGTSPRAIAGQVSALTVTLSDAGDYSFRLRTNGPGSFTAKNVQIELGSPATEWSPYSNICSITGNTGVTVERTDGDGQQSASVSVTFPALGKNLFDYTKDYKADGKFWNSEIGELTSNAYFYGSPKIPVQPNTTYTRNEGATANLYFDSEGNFLNSAGSVSTFTTPAGCYYAAFNIAVSVDDTTVQLEKGSTATTYEPYTNTVYGGTVDFTAGVLRITHKTIQLESLTWTTQTDRARARIDDIKPPASTSTLADTKSDRYIQRRANQILIANTYAVLDSPTNNIVFYYDGETPTGQFVYEIKEPIEISLTPQTLAMLAGTNILQSAEADDLSLTYKATN